MANHLALVIVHSVAAALGLTVGTLLSLTAVAGGPWLRLGQFAQTSTTPWISADAADLQYRCIGIVLNQVGHTPVC